MNKRIDILAIFLVALLLIASCGKNADGDLERETAITDTNNVSLNIKEENVISQDDETIADNMSFCRINRPLEAYLCGKRRNNRCI